MVLPLLVQRRTTDVGQGFVYLCRALRPTASPRPDEIQDVRFFDRLPSRAELSFPDDPYEALFDAVRRALVSKLL